MDSKNFIIGPDDPILVTGATGFIGPKLVESLLRHGFRNLRLFVRPSSDATRLEAVAGQYQDGARVEVINGNLLSEEDCITATRGVAVIFHLATSGDKSFAGAFMNSVVTTRNLLESSLHHTRLRRFVNISSFAVYSNTNKSRWKPLDETSPLETHAASSGDAYRFAKVKQDEIVTEYGEKFGIPYVIVRPGSVYGPGKESITGRVGIDSFGIFLHMGGSNLIPFTYIDNCAEAIVLAGVKAGVEKEIFNVVDDDLISSRRFLSLYKRNVRRFSSIYVPHLVSYALCSLWEKYSIWSRGQLPPAFNRRRWHAEWKSTRYSNQKLKTRLGWAPKVPMREGLVRYFESCRERRHA
ncbi:MAG TPA: NAD(P)-dependent oxidoreductase [Terriglobales bacterium]|jgi:nucleoside-diphosphate-sugar epimerase|nr:NAD(P)-dependent oxidoreductase [Terriglobales bacterium]